MRNVVVAERYQIIAACELALTDVVLHHRSMSRPAWSANLANERDELIARYFDSGRPLLTDRNGSLPLLYRLDGVDLDQTGLVIRTSETDYAEHLLTNVEHPEWRLERGPGVMAEAIGVSAVVQTSDGHVVLGRRSPRTHEGVGALHVIPSGHPHPPQTIRDALYAELRDELGLRPDELSDEVVTGVARALPSGKPEITARFVARVSLVEVFDRWTSAEERWEFDSLESLAWRPDAIETWLHNNVSTIVAPGHAALALAGGVDFGRAWLLRLVTALATQ
jgi:ADP-ribose pyrophosphatase YjhB (NUDIX family)